MEVKNIIIKIKKILKGKKNKNKNIEEKRISCKKKIRIIIVSGDIADVDSTIEFLN